MYRSVAAGMLHHQIVAGAKASEVAQLGPKINKQLFTS